MSLLFYGKSFIAEQTIGFGYSEYPRVWVQKASKIYNQPPGIPRTADSIYSRKNNEPSSHACMDIWRLTRGSNTPQLAALEF